MENAESYLPFVYLSVSCVSSGSEAARKVVRSYQIGKSALHFAAGTRSMRLSVTPKAQSASRSGCLCFGSPPESATVRRCFTASLTVHLSQATGACSNAVIAIKAPTGRSSVQVPRRRAASDPTNAPRRKEVQMLRRIPALNQWVSHGPWEFLTGIP